MHLIKNIMGHSFSIICPIVTQFDALYMHTCNTFVRPISRIVDFRILKIYSLVLHSSLVSTDLKKIEPSIDEARTLIMGLFLVSNQLSLTIVHPYIFYLSLMHESLSLTYFISSSRYLFPNWKELGGLYEGLTFVVA